MDQIEAAILFLLRHVASHADGPTAKQAQKHLDAVEQVFARAGSEYSGAAQNEPAPAPVTADDSHPAGDTPMAPADQSPVTK